MQQLVFLTGSTGLIGGNLLAHLYKSGASIRALIRKTSSFSQLRLICDFYGIDFQKLYDTVEWVYGDTLDFIGLRDALKGVDTVYHCAAIVSFNKKNRNELLRTNIQGTANMVDASLECGVSHFCFISSIGALGQAKKGDYIDEKSARDINSPRSSYSQSKYLSELEVWRGSAEGLNCVILNPGVVLGPGSLDKGSMQLFKLASKGFPFYTDLMTGYVDVRDICRAAMELVSKKIAGERFVLVSENIDNKRLFTQIAGEFGEKGPATHVGKRMLSALACLLSIYSFISGKSPQLTRETVHTASHPEQYSSQLIQSTLGFRFTPIDETIHDIAAFFKKQR